MTFRSLLFACAAICAGPAYAQQSAPTAKAAPAADQPALEEVIVTAQKRAESLQDVPVSVVALGSEQLKARGLTAVTDLMSGSIPALRITTTAGRTSTVAISMRGIPALLSISAMRLASSNASFGSADIRFHTPTPGMLPYAVWSALFMTHRQLTAQTALGWNLINDVVEDHLLETRTFELAARLAEILPRSPVVGRESQALSEFMSGDPLGDHGFAVYVVNAHRVYPLEETQAVALRRRPKLRRSNDAG